MSKKEEVELHPTPNLDSQASDVKAVVTKPVVEIPKIQTVEVDYRFSTED